MTSEKKPAPILRVIKRRITWAEFFRLRPDRAPPAAANDNGLISATKSAA